MEVASAKLRKTFKRKEDDGSDDEPLVIDEEEQEKLITQLKKENEEKNEAYLQMFLILPSVSWILFVASFVKSPSTSARYLSVLGTASLWATSYNLLLIPTKPGTGQDLSPAQRWVPILNAGVSILVAFRGLAFRDGRGVIDGFWLMCFVPLIEYIMIQMARRWLVEVDLSDLEQFKYELRGA